MSSQSGRGEASGLVVMPVGEVGSPDASPLPRGWVWTTLGEVTRPRGLRLSPSKMPGAPFVGLEHIEAHSMKLIGTGQASQMKSAAAYFGPGDVLYGRLRPYLNKIYKPDFEGLASGEFIVFACQPNMDNGYLQYFLNSWAFVTFATRLNTGDRPRVDFEQLSGYPFPLPPLPEQRRIVAEIETHFTRLDAAVASLQRARANLKRYRASVLKAACEGRLVPTEAEIARREGRAYEPASVLLERILKERRARWEAQPGRRGKYQEPQSPDTSHLPPLPDGWAWASGDMLFGFVTSGSRGWARYYSWDGALFLRVGNLDHYSITLDLEEIQHVRPPTSAEGIRTRVLPNDILISITADVGMVALIPEEFGEEAYINQHVALARPGPRTYTPYLAWFLASDDAKQQFRAMDRGATKMGLGLDDIRSVSVALPPIAEQQRIVAEVERHMSVIQAAENVVEANLKRAERLRQAILKRAFQGKLVPQDPGDEDVGTKHPRFEEDASPLRRHVSRSPLRV